MINLFITKMETRVPWKELRTDTRSVGINSSSQAELGKPEHRDELRQRKQWACYTVTIFNFCTKCMGIPDIIHDRTPDCHPVMGMGAWMNLKLNVALIRKMRGSLMCLAYF